MKDEVCASIEVKCASHRVVKRHNRHNRHYTVYMWCITPPPHLKFFHPIRPYPSSPKTLTPHTEIFSFPFLFSNLVFISLSIPSSLTEGMGHISRSRKDRQASSEQVSTTPRGKNQFDYGAGGTGEKLCIHIANTLGSREALQRISYKMDTPTE